MNKILSIAVNACGKKTHIEKCLNSFMDAEIIRRIEVIIVDDGADVRTAQIAEKYARMYPDTFIYIRQKSTAQGAAVNKALLKASGRYFCIMSGDDWLNTRDIPAFTEFLEETQTDMVCTGWCSVNRSTGHRSEHSLMMSGKDSSHKLYFAEICSRLSFRKSNILYLTELLRKNAIVFDSCDHIEMEYLLLPVPYVETVVFTESIMCMKGYSSASRRTRIAQRQKAVDDYAAVLKRICEDYRCYRYSRHWDTVKGDYYSTEITYAAAFLLGIYLSFPDTGKYRAETIKMVNTLRGRYPEVYSKLPNIRNFRLLIGSYFFLYDLLSLMYREYGK